MKYALPAPRTARRRAAQQHRDDRVDRRASAATASGPATPRARAASSRSPGSSRCSTGHAACAANCICPGAVDTPMTGGVWDSDESRARMKRDVPLGVVAAGRRHRLGRRLPALARRAPPHRSGHGGRRRLDGHLSTTVTRPWFGLFLPAAADELRRHPRAHARRRGRRLRLRVAHGPPRRAGRARARHVRGLDPRRRARGAHHDDPHRPPGHVRPVPAPGGARQDGRDRRRDLRRPARARHRLGLGPRRARDLRDRRRPATRAGGAPRPSRSRCST